MSERPALAPVKVGDYWVIALSDCGANRDRYEREIGERGGVLPLPHRAVWARRHSPRQWFVAILNGQGACEAGFGVDVGGSRALPGHRLLRADRVGTGMPPAALAAGLTALGQWATQHRRVLRVTVQCFSPDGAVRAVLERALIDAGFSPAQQPRSYTTTIWWDLAGTDEERMAALSRKTRRDVRYGVRKPLRLETLEDQRWIPRLESLFQETMARTGGRLAAPRWSAIQDLCRAAPEASRLVGLVRSDIEGPEALLSFAWGCCHGSYAHYDHGASTRQTDLKHPLGYALIWDLACWAADVGAESFDLGGVTVATDDGSDVLHGISDFKRHFCTTVLTVASEWDLEPHPFRAKLAKAIGAVAGPLMRRLT